jgi:hypothetical protein
MYSYYLNIAKLVLKIESPRILSFQSSVQPFETKESEEPNVVYSMSFEETMTVKKKIIYKGDFIAFLEGDEIGRTKGITTTKGIESVTLRKKDRDSFSIFLPKSLKEEKVLFKQINLMNYLAFEDVLINHQGFILHSSFISWQNNGILFTAPSGTGKSTQADLWKKYEDADIYNGDRTIIRKIDGKYYGFGSPYAGSSGIYRNESAPIKAIVVIEQGPDNVIRRLHGREAFLPLFRETLMNTWNKEYMEKMTDLLMDVACQIPVYHLSCRPDQGAVNTVKNEILKEL